MSSQRKQIETYDVRGTLSKYPVFTSISKDALEELIDFSIAYKSQGGNLSDFLHDTFEQAEKMKKKPGRLTLDLLHSAIEKNPKTKAIYDTVMLPEEETVENPPIPEMPNNELKMSEGASLPEAPTIPESKAIGLPETLIPQTSPLPAMPSANVEKRMQEFKDLIRNTLKKEYVNVTISPQAVKYFAESLLKFYQTSTMEKIREIVEKVLEKADDIAYKRVKGEEKARITPKIVEMAFETANIPAGEQVLTALPELPQIVETIPDLTVPQIPEALPNFSPLSTLPPIPVPSMKSPRVQVPQAQIPVSPIPKSPQELPSLPEILQVISPPKPVLVSPNPNYLTVAKAEKLINDYPEYTKSIWPIQMLTKHQIEEKAHEFIELFLSMLNNSLINNLPSTNVKEISDSNLSMIVEKSFGLPETSDLVREAILGAKRIREIKDKEYDAFSSKDKRIRYQKTGAMINEILKSVASEMIVFATPDIIDDHAPLVLENIVYAINDDNRLKAIYKSIF